jgi:hypothetical protein
MFNIVVKPRKSVPNDENEIIAIVQGDCDFYCGDVPDEFGLAICLFPRNQPPLLLYLKCDDSVFPKNY